MTDLVANIKGATCDAYFQLCLVHDDASHLIGSYEIEECSLEELTDMCSSLGTMPYAEHGTSIENFPYSMRSYGTAVGVDYVGRGTKGSMKFQWSHNRHVSKDGNDPSLRINVTIDNLHVRRGLGKAEGSGRKWLIFGMKAVDGDTDTLRSLKELLDR